MHPKRKSVLALLIALLFASVTSANVVLPSIFTDHMVLQQQSEVSIWGWGKPREPIQITTTWSHDTIKTKVGSNCDWQIRIKTPKAGGPYSIHVKGYNQITLHEVLIGEVWLCSGQSNMEWSANMKIDHAEEEIKNAQFPQIRFLTIWHRSSDTPQADVISSNWENCSPESMQNFSALAYFFARKLHTTLNVPIGMIHSSLGGTTGEVWVKPDYILSDSILKSAAEKLKPAEWGPIKPGQLYFAMIEPLRKFRIAGTLWYQGETNVDNPASYDKLLSALVKNWRNDWGYEFPFIYAQIAPNKGYGKNESCAVLRDAQRKAMTIPNSGMIVTSDIGDLDNFHPGNKQDVGLRMANWALKMAYKQNTGTVSGPMYKSHSVVGHKIKIEFDFAENGLLCKGKELSEFEMAGADGKFEKAEARIIGNAILVYSKKIKIPVSVRFGWHYDSNPNLFNKEGLPASCFKTN